MEIIKIANNFVLKCKIIGIIMIIFSFIILGIGYFTNDNHDIETGFLILSNAMLLTGVIVLLFSWSIKRKLNKINLKQ